MTDRATAAPGTGTDDGAVSLALRSLRRLVMIFVLVDIITGSIDGSSTGESGVTAVFVGQSLLVAVATAAVIWHRTLVAVLLTGAAFVASVTLGPTGEELSLQLSVAVVAGATARRRRLALVVVALLVYVGAFAAHQQHEVPGWGRPVLITDLILTAIGLSVGLVARALLRRDRRRRAELALLRAENAVIADRERTQLADDLQSVVTHGLDVLRSEVDRISAAPFSPVRQRAGLARIDTRCRAVLEELRALLDLLRSDPAAPVPERAGRATVWLGRALHAAAGRRPWATWTAVLAVLAAVAQLGYVVLTGDTTGWDAIAVAVLGLVGTAWFGPRRWWLVAGVLVAYGGARWLAGLGSGRYFALLLAGGLIGLLLGLTIHHFRQSQADGERRRAELLAERERAGPEQRSAVARELHDVVAHQLSVTTMVVMAGGLSEDPVTLDRTVARVRRSVDAARSELDALLHAMRGPAAAASRPAPLASPVSTATTLARRLTEQGFGPAMAIDPRADELDPTTQRTLSRIMQEATTNVLRYAPPTSTCRFELRVRPDRVLLQIINPLAGQERRSRHSLGWGLRGVRERVDLCHGSFAAGSRDGEWRVQVSLPRSTAAPVEVAVAPATTAAARS